MTPPTLDEIKLAHSGHQKWWRGQALTTEEQHAITKCNGFDITGMLIDMVEAAPEPLVSAKP